MLTFTTIVLGIIGVAQGWGASNRRRENRQAPVEAAKRAIRQDDEAGEASEAEREAIRRDEVKNRVRFR